MVLPKGRRIKVGMGFDAATPQIVAVLERMDISRPTINGCLMQVVSGYQQSVRRTLF